MVREYLKFEETKGLNWRIKPQIEYMIVGEIEDFYFIWANYHQLAIHKKLSYQIRREETNDYYFWVKPKRAWPKGEIKS